MRVIKIIFIVTLLSFFFNYLAHNSLNFWGESIVSFWTITNVFFLLLISVMVLMLIIVKDFFPFYNDNEKQYNLYYKFYTYWSEENKQFIPDSFKNLGVQLGSQVLITYKTDCKKKIYDIGYCTRPPQRKSVPHNDLNMIIHIPNSNYYEGEKYFHFLTLAEDEKVEYIEKLYKVVNI